MLPLLGDKANQWNFPERLNYIAVSHKSDRSRPARQVINFSILEYTVYSPVQSGRLGQCHAL